MFVFLGIPQEKIRTALLDTHSYENVPNYTNTFSIRIVEEEIKSGDATARFDGMLEDP
jgi:hypothetical protein